MAGNPYETFVEVTNPTVAGSARVTLAAYEQVWAALGWSLVDDASSVVDYSSQNLTAWAEAGAWIALGDIARDSRTGTLTSATVTWPDGSTGAYVGTVDTNGQLLSYNVTHSRSGRTVSQPAVTRDASGEVSVKPGLVVT